MYEPFGTLETEALQQRTAAHIGRFDAQHNIMNTLYFGAANKSITYDDLVCNDLERILDRNEIDKYLNYINRNLVQPIGKAYVNAYTNAMNSMNF